MRSSSEVVAGVRMPSFSCFRVASASAGMTFSASRRSLGRYACISASLTVSSAAVSSASSPPEASSPSAASPSPSTSLDAWSMFSSSTSSSSSSPEPVDAMGTASSPMIMRRASSME